MKQIIRKAYAKINLGLDVVRRRPDGYHEVKMIMQTISLHDELRFEETGGKEIILVSNSDCSRNGRWKYRCGSRFSWIE